MKKKIMLLIVTVVLVVAVSSYATVQFFSDDTNVNENGTMNAKQEPLANEDSTTMVLEEVNVKEADFGENSNGKITSEENTETEILPVENNTTEATPEMLITEGSNVEVKPIEDISKFKGMAAKLGEQIEDEAEYNITLVNYKYLEKGYALDKTILDYICDLIISGYNGKDVIDATYFWLDTSEDIAIIETMCEWKAKNTDYAGKFWEENAFNFATGNKYGVLSEEDFDAYAEKGITSDKIMIANRLSRKGEYTIQEILEKYQNGKTMAEIAVDIDTKLYEKKRSGYALNASQNTSLQKVDDSEIFLSRELAMISGQTETMYLKANDENTDISAELDAVSEKLLEEIKAELKTGGYLRTREKEAE